MAFHYLVDGFNLLYALPEIPPGTWEEKRQALLDLLRERQPHGKNRLTVVFDSRQGSGNRQEFPTIDVVYTAGETADDWISRRVRELSNPRNVIVVTNDRGLQHLLRGTGARVLSTEDFLKSPRSSIKPTAHPPTEALDDITNEFKKKWL